MKIDKYKSLLWELSKPGGVESSYLFGTIHLPERSLWFRMDEVKELLLSCSSFMAEYPLDDQSEEGTAIFELEEGQQLNDILPAKKLLRLRKQLQKSFGQDIGSYASLKPMILEQVLAESFVSDHSGVPMDVMLWRYASSAGKRMRGAESMESQIALLKSFPLKMQLKQLLNIGKQPDKYKQQVERLKTLYLEENIRALYKSSLKSLGKMKSKLVYDRNVKIKDAILSEMKEGKCFCAVGAGHLYGEKGLLRLLKHEDLQISPLPNNV